jgi:transcriptional regulator with XRE-family HTH domain
MEHEALKRARKAAGMTQAEVAKAIGVHAITVHKMETGKMSVSLQHLLKLSKLYGLSLSALVGEGPVVPAVVVPPAVKDVVTLLRNTSIPADIRAAAAAEKLSQIMERQ